MKKKIMFIIMAIMAIIIIILSSLLISGVHKTKLKNGQEVAFELKNEKFSADKLYTQIKKKNGVAIMLDMVDKSIFNKIYKDDEKIDKQATTQIETYKSQYKDSWDDTLKNAGYSSESELKDELILNFQRQKAVDDYVKNSIKEDEIKKYYSETTVGDISAKHILIKVDTSSDDGLTDDEAQKKAKDLIKKLDKGEDFDTLAKENSDDTGSKEKGGDLGYFNKGDMVEEFEKAAFDLKVNEYTKEPVKTTYGYHIILKTGEKDKPKYKEVKDKILEKLTNERMENDSTIQITALEETRKKYGLKIKDSKLKSLYKKYINSQIEAAEKQANQNN